MYASLFGLAIEPQTWSDPLHPIDLHSIDRLLHACCGTRLSIHRARLHVDQFPYMAIEVLKSMFIHEAVIWRFLKG